MKEFEAEGFHLETEAIKFLKEKGWKGVSVRHLNGKTSAFSIGSDPDEKGFMEEDFFCRKCLRQRRQPPQCG